jgi:hypothetical protein
VHGEPDAEYLAGAKMSMRHGGILQVLVEGLH